MRVPRAAILILLTVAGSPAFAASRCDELVAAAHADDVAAVARLINGGESVNCRDPLTAETPLMSAAVDGRLDIVRFLLTLKADPNVKSVNGETALDMVRAREATFSKMPNFADLARRQREVIAALTPVTAGGASRPVDPVQAVPTDLNLVAKLKLDGARASMMAGRLDPARQAVLEVLQMRNTVSLATRARAFAMACDLGLRARDLEFAKTMCEAVLKIPDASDDDREYATDTLKAIRRIQPQLFK
jgi:hypothetical protein